MSDACVARPQRPHLMDGQACSEDSDECMAAEHLLNLAAGQAAGDDRGTITRGLAEDALMQDAGYCSSDDCSGGARQSHRPRTAHKRASVVRRQHAVPAADRSMGDKRSNFRGVFWDRKNCRWRSQVGYQNRKIFMGYFNDAEAAARAYDRKLVQLHGALAKTNFRINEYMAEVLEHEAAALAVPPPPPPVAPGHGGGGRGGVPNLAPPPAQSELSGGGGGAAADAALAGVGAGLDGGSEPLPGLGAVVKGLRGKRKKCEVFSRLPIPGDWASDNSTDADAADQDQTTSHASAAQPDMTVRPAALPAPLCELAAKHEAGWCGAAPAGGVRAAGQHCGAAGAASCSSNSSGMCAGAAAPPPAGLRVCSEPAMGSSAAATLPPRAASEPCMALTPHGLCVDDAGPALPPPAKLQRLGSRESSAARALAGMVALPPDATAAAAAPPPPAPAHAHGGARQPRDAFGRFQPKHGPFGAVTHEPAFRAAPRLAQALIWQPQHALQPTAAAGACLQQQQQQQEHSAEAVAEAPEPLPATAAPLSAGARPGGVLHCELLARVLAAQNNRQAGALEALMDTAMAMVAADALSPSMAVALQRYLAALNNSSSAPQEPAAADSSGAGAAGAPAPVTAAAPGSAAPPPPHASEGVPREPAEDRAAHPGAAPTSCEANPGAAAPALCTAPTSASPSPPCGAPPPPSAPADSAIQRWGSGSNDDEAAPTATTHAAETLPAPAPTRPGLAPPAFAHQMHLLPAQLLHLPRDAEHSPACLQQFLRGAVVPAAAEAAARLLQHHPGAPPPVVVVAPVIVPYAAHPVPSMAAAATAHAAQ